MEVLVAIGALIAAVIAFVIHSKKQRRAELMAKYQDAAVVERIMDKKVWMGMSQEQLIDSWGRPEATDQKVYKTKMVETFKYNRTGRNRFRSRVKVENGTVTGWEQK